MKNIFRNLSLLLGLLWVAPLPAQTSAALATPPSVVSSSNEEHPFFLSGIYPEWSKLTARQAYTDARAAMALTRARVEAICELDPEQANFDNTFLAIEKCTSELQNMLFALQHLAQVKDSAEIRDAVQQISSEFTDLQADIYTNDRLWILMKAASRPERLEGLSTAKRRAVKQLCDIFRDNGAELPLESKKRKIEIDKELISLCLQYDKNLQDYTQSWEYLVTEPALLAGVPEVIIRELYRAALEAGYATAEKPAWLISLRDETAITVMTYCDVEATRKKCWEGVRGICTSGKYDNGPIVMRIMELRQELAELLGFRHFADYSARTHMVSTGDQALTFVNNLIEEIRPAYDAELSQMMALYREFIGKDVAALPPWDELYAAIIYFSNHEGMDTEDISPYLKASNVINGMFAVYGELFGLTFRQIPSVCLKPGETCPEGKVEVWHPSVKVIGVYDAVSGAHYGSFYMDLFRRDDKRAGGWCSPIRLANPGPDGRMVEPHIGALVTNFDPPIKGKITLFDHGDVQVLFHEFGHMLHHLLSHTELQGHCAMGVAWDFSELPSTLFENWAWNPDVLSAFAFHYKTGKPYPKDQLELFVKRRYFMVAGKYMDMLRQSRLDMELHMHYKEKFHGKSLDAVSAELTQGLTLPFTQAQPSEMRNLPHCISGGYCAGLYTYAWSEVLASDAYTRFEHEGIDNKNVGRVFRKTILELGDSVAADELYRMFMGRDPNPDAFLKARGFKK